MRWVTERVRGREHERGAVAVVVAILLSGFLLGLGAIVTDTGSWYSERAQLQNGADGASLAVALACAHGATGCPSKATVDALAGQYANRNANDAKSFVDVVCGKGPNLATCDIAHPANGKYCPEPPANGANYVNVHTSTLTTSDSHLLPPVMGTLLGETDDGHRIKSCAQASWGSAGLGVNVAFTIAVCEWDAATNGGTNYAPDPPTVPNPGFERILTASLPDSPTNPACTGAGGSPLPGGFGWTAESGDGNCTVNLTAIGSDWYESGPGKATENTSGCGANGARSSGVIPCAQNSVVTSPPYPQSANPCPTPATPSPLVVPVYDQVCVQPGTVAASEVQTVTLSNATSGTYTLTFANTTTSATTAPIAYNATAAAVQTALTALSTIGAGNVSVAGATGGPYTVTFTGALANTDVQELTVDFTALRPNTGPVANRAKVTIATTTAGSSSTTGCPAGFSNGKYFHLTTLAAFVVTGWNGAELNLSAPPNKNSWLTNRDYCLNPSHGTDSPCLMGYFVKDVVPGDVGDGDDTGVTVVTLTG
jgi:Flp pilus assembly protein TadG